MRLFILVVLATSCRSQNLNSPILQEGAYFPHTSTQMTKLILSGDSLKTIHINALGDEEMSGMYKIDKARNKNSIDIVAIRLIDYSKRSEKPYFDYAVYAFRTPDGNRIVMVHSRSFSTKAERDVYFDTINVHEMHGLTFYKKNYFDRFDKLKKIQSKEDVEILFSTMTSNVYKRRIQELNKFIEPDMYGMMKTSELLNQACIENGYNPLRAQKHLNKIMKPLKSKDAE